MTTPFIGLNSNVYPFDPSEPLYDFIPRNVNDIYAMNPNYNNNNNPPKTDTFESKKGSVNWKKVGFWALTATLLAVGAAKIFGKGKGLKLPEGFWKNLKDSATNGINNLGKSIVNGFNTVKIAVLNFFKKAPVNPPTTP